MASKRKRNELSAKEKVDLLDKFHALEQCSKRQAADSLGVSRTLLRSMLDQEHELRKEVEIGGTDRKRNRTGKDEDVENGLFQWFEHVRSRHAPVNGPILCQKAEEIAKKLGHNDFKATDGWFGRWKHRHGLSFKKLQGEAASADTDAAAQWKKDVMEDILKSYSPNLVYNADETGIYFRALPDSTYVAREQSRQGRGFKTAKDRITALVCCNMDGGKEKLLVIGKSKNPRCFKNVKTFPVTYDSSKNAWMTESIWSNWLKSWNKRLKTEKKKILLLVDNCSAHGEVSGLTNIEVKFLPPNTTSVLQPCDQGIIRTMKAYFRHEMRRSIIDVLDDGDENLTANEVAKKMTLLDAMHKLDEAWKRVTLGTIKNCWRKGGFSPSRNAEDDGGVREVEPPPGLEQDEFQAWIDMESGVSVTEPDPEDDQEVLDRIVTGLAADSSVEPPVEDDDEEEEEVEVVPESTPSNTEMRTCLHRLLVGLERRGFGDADINDFKSVQSRIRDFIRRQPLSQSDIRSFFTPKS